MVKTTFSSAENLDFIVSFKLLSLFKIGKTSHPAIYFFSSLGFLKNPAGPTNS